MNLGKIYLWTISICFSQFKKFWLMVRNNKGNILEPEYLLNDYTTSAISTISFSWLNKI